MSEAASHSPAGAGDVLSAGHSCARPRFEKYWLKLSAVERLTTGLRWAEGPVWFGDGPSVVQRYSNNRSSMGKKKPAREHLS